MVSVESSLRQVCRCPSHQAALSEFSPGSAYLPKRKPEATWGEQNCDADTPFGHLASRKRISLECPRSAPGRSLQISPCKHRPVLWGETPLHLHFASAPLLRGSLLSVSVSQTQVFFWVPSLPRCSRLPLLSGFQVRGGGCAGDYPVHCEPSACVYRASCFPAALWRFLEFHQTFCRAHTRVDLVLCLSSSLRFPFLSVCGSARSSLLPLPSGIAVVLFLSSCCSRVFALAGGPQSFPRGKFGEFALQICSVGLAPASFSHRFFVLFVGRTFDLRIQAGAGGRCSCCEEIISRKSCSRRFPTRSPIARLRFFDLKGVGALGEDQCP